MTTQFYLVRSEDDLKQVHQTRYETLGEAITAYERYTDWGFCDEWRDVLLIGPSGDVIVKKRFHRPTK